MIYGDGAAIEAPDKAVGYGETPLAINVIKCCRRSACSAGGRRETLGCERRPETVTMSSWPGDARGYTTLADDRPELPQNGVATAALPSRDRDEERCSFLLIVVSFGEQKRYLSTFVHAKNLFLHGSSYAALQCI